MSAGIDESLRPNEDPAAYVQRLARSKAEAVAKNLRRLGARRGYDCRRRNQILGQPVDDADAKRMLRLLNGKWHDVLTGVAVVRVGGESRVAYETTRVRFAEMSESEIDWYISTGEPSGQSGRLRHTGRPRRSSSKRSKETISTSWDCRSGLVYELAELTITDKNKYDPPSTLMP